MKNLYAIALIFACMVGSALYSAALGQQIAGSSPVEVNIKLRGIDDKMYDIREMKGSVLLVSFGATWCSPCWAELRALEELRNEYRDQPVKFLWVSIDRREQLSDGGLREFVKEHRLTFPVLRDPTQLTYAQFSTRTRLPFVVFFDKDGNLAAPRHVGMTQPEAYKKIIRDNLDKLLKDKPAADASSAR
ncbi:MAG: TlpA family protein disulfide reductase [Acidobacteria bacterium]|nr:TlpA family protein disulfide reductase [Acidobacteriota bacterium]